MIICPYAPTIPCSFDHMILEFHDYYYVIMWWYDHMVTWSHGHIDITSYDPKIIIIIRSDHMMISNHMMKSSHDHMFAWQPDRMMTWSHGDMIIEWCDPIMNMWSHLILRGGEGCVWVSNRNPKPPAASSRLATAAWLHVLEQHWANPKKTPLIFSPRFCTLHNNVSPEIPRTHSPKMPNPG